MIIYSGHGQKMIQKMVVYLPMNHGRILLFSSIVPRLSMGGSSPYSTSEKIVFGGLKTMSESLFSDFARWFLTPRITSTILFVISLRAREAATAALS
ncbi:hypothetical protein PENTCL1PPCAC_28767, partial [Pristionchus entomophagus]